MYIFLHLEVSHSSEIYKFAAVCWHTKGLLFYAFANYLNFRSVLILSNLLQVIIKDFVSRAVVSQFRAHTSPISALCFDPSGTLLVTASIYGNNINIFRIMPSCLQNGSGTRNYDWNSSHVHLYKLHRGMTSAVCFFNFCFTSLFSWRGCFIRMLYGYSLCFVC